MRQKSKSTAINLNKLIHIPIDIYNANLHVYYGSDISLLEKQCTSYFKGADLERVQKVFEDEFENVRGLSFNITNKEYFVFIHNRKDNIIDELSILTHELLHFICGLFRTIDLPLSKESEEAYTYLLGFVNKRCYEELNIFGSIKK